MSIVEMKVPVIGESITEVTLSSWLKGNGEYVNMDESICEFESDKATLEFPAEASGKLIYIAAEGDDLAIGAHVANIDTSVKPESQIKQRSISNPKQETEELKIDPKAIEKAQTSNVGTIKMIVPVIGESITEVTLSEWLVKDGAIVKIDDPICEFESDKATLEFPAEVSGQIKQIAKEGDDLKIGALVAEIDTSKASEATIPKDETLTESAKPSEVPSSPTYASGHPSPAAAKILKEKNIQPSTVSGTGKDGRIRKEDALAAQKQKSSKNPNPSESLSKAKVNTAAYNRSTRREKMSRMRRTIASRLVSAKNDTAMLTTFNEVDLSNIIALRKKYQEQFVEKHGIKLGFMSLFSKACANVLMEMPQVNAIIDGNELIYHDYVDISIAISTPTGLVVPPVHNVESMEFHEIELKIKVLAEKARIGKLTLEEMQGGTFSITNGGIFGSMMSTPILNQPQSAILGMHNIIQRPVAINGNVEIRPMMYLALSYDHRVIDGSTSVTFLVKVIELLEDPMRLMMNI